MKKKEEWVAEVEKVELGDRVEVEEEAGGQGDSSVPCLRSLLSPLNNHHLEIQKSFQDALPTSVVKLQRSPLLRESSLAAVIVETTAFSSLS